MADDITASVTVTVTLEIPSRSTWSGNYDISQIEKQATETVLNRLDKNIGLAKYKLIGKPIVSAILVRRK